MDVDSTILSVLAAGGAECHTVVERHGGLFTSLFAAGLLGSMTHCVGMCGPFVAGQVVARLEARPAADMREFHRLTGAALLPYHLGRTTTYAGSGESALANRLGRLVRPLSRGPLAGAATHSASPSALFPAACSTAPWPRRPLRPGRSPARSACSPSLPTRYRRLSRSAWRATLPGEPGSR